jgi:hypothetical protein
VERLARTDEHDEMIRSTAAKKLTDKALVSRVKRGFQKIKSELPYLIELRARFDALPRGKANIDMCKTWTEFCEKRLHRTYRQIRRVLAEAEGTTVDVKQEPVEVQETVTRVGLIAGEVEPTTTRAAITTMREEWRDPDEERLTRGNKIILPTPPPGLPSRSPDSLNEDQATVTEVMKTTIPHGLRKSYHQETLSKARRLMDQATETIELVDATADELDTSPSQWTAFDVATKRLMDSIEHLNQRRSQTIH